VYGANGAKDRTDKFLCATPGIVVGRKGSAGEITLTEDKFWPLDVTYFVEFDRAAFDLRFLYHLLSRLDLPSLAKGVKPGINRNEIYAIPVDTPPRAEQQRIVAILDEAFEGIATAKANAEKNLLNAREVFDNHHEAAFRRAAECGVTHRLGELATFRNGINFTKQSKGQSVAIVGVKDFQDHLWAPLEDLDSVTLDGELSDADTLAEGDILSVRSNGNPALIGRCMLVGSMSEPVTHSGFTIRIRLNHADALPKYVCYFLKSPPVRRQLVDGGNGSNIKSLNQGTLSAVGVPLLDLDTQRSVVVALEAVAAETARLTEAVHRKLAALNELKKSLLHQAFSGAL
jgi:type I restriction enzyme S subunit